MSNEPQTYRLLVTLPDTTGEDADVVAGILASYLNEGAGDDAMHIATVTHAPQLWVLMIDGPEFDSARIFATERECYQHLIDYAADELGHRMPNSFAAMHPLMILNWFSDQGYVINVEPHDYPVHPASVSS